MGGSSAALLGPGHAEAAETFVSGRPETTTGRFTEDRFLTRARALFYARLAFLTLGLLVIAVPSWSREFRVGGTAAFAVYLAMVAYSAANYAILARPRIGRAVTFVTLCCDLCVLVWLVAGTGGLRSPLLAAQLLFTTLFAILALVTMTVGILVGLAPVLQSRRADLVEDLKSGAREGRYQRSHIRAALVVAHRRDHDHLAVGGDLDRRLGVDVETVE